MPLPRPSLLSALFVLLMIFNASQLEAQVPANDECAGAVVVGSLPFTYSENTRLATSNATDPVLPCADGGGGKTVWFVFTPSVSQTLSFTTEGSAPADYDIAMGLLTGSCGALTLIGCNDDIDPGVVRQSQITYAVQAGVTYYIHVAEWKGGGPNGGVPTGGDLVFMVSTPIVPPLAKGPKNGSIPSGVTITTDSYGPEAPPGPPVQLAIRNKPQVGLLPDPKNLRPPTGPEGSNYIEDKTTKVVATASSRPIIFEDFQGIPDLGNLIPPDPDVDVGPNHVLGVVNSRFRIWDKTGTVLKTIDAAQWFSPVAPGNWGPFDPQIIFDHFANRWVMTWAHVQDTASATILLAVSDDANPLGTWYAWAMPSNTLGDSATQLFDDYPQLGYDSEAIYLTGRNFGLVSGIGLAFNRVRIIPKTLLYANTAGRLSWTDLWDFRDPDSRSTRPDGIRSCVVFGNPGVHFLVCASSFETGTYFTVWTIHDPLGTPTVTAANIPVVAYTSPPGANQLGGSTILIESGGRAVRGQPVYRDSSLWLVHNVASGTGNAYSAVRYVRLNPFTGVATEDQAVGADGFWHYYSALMVDKDKNVLVTFTRSGVTEYAGAFVSGRKEGDPPGLSQTIPLKPGMANYVKDFGSGRNRWGDYNGIGLDPADGNALWVLTEYAASPANTWGTWVGKVKMGPLPGAYAQAEPSLLLYDRTEVGRIGDTLTVGLFNAGYDILTVTSITPPGSDFALVNPPALPFSVGSLESTTLRVAFTPTQAGDRIDSVVLATNDVTNGLLTLRLSGRGVVVTAAQTGHLYAASGTPTPRLYTVNGGTGSATPTGNISTADLHGLTIRPSTDQIYGVTTTKDSTQLYLISSSSGETVPLTTFRIGNMRAIAFSPGDTLYGATLTGRLYRLNPATGDTAFVGLAAGIAYSSLTFQPSTGALWASVRPTLTGKDKIYTVNTSNGDTTMVGATGKNQVTPAIAFDGTGALYAMLGTGGATNELYRLNTTTGAATLIGSMGVSGLQSMVTRNDGPATGVEERSAETGPLAFSLDQNYPNPFNPTTDIRFQISDFGWVKLAVYDMLGREVKLLVNEALQPGRYTSRFDAAGIASGVYLYRLTAGQFVQTRRMIVIK